MKRSLLLLPLALAACSKSVSLEPGHWDMTMTMKDIQAPGAPPEAMAMARQMLSGPPMKSARCISDAQAGQPNAGLFQSDASDNCTNEQFTMAGGKIDIKMTCRPSSGVQHRTVTGTYTADTLNATATVTRQQPGVPGDMTVTMAMDGKHNGACNGHEDK